MVHHAGWDGSWPVPTAEDIDDLEELGLLRTEVGHNTKRIFSPTVKGREQAGLLAEQRSSGFSKGRAPALTEVMSWLVEQQSSRPETFDVPSRLLDAAIRARMIDGNSRGALAASLIQLAEEGFLAGDIPDYDNASPEQRLGLASGLALTIKAHDRVQNEPSRPTSLHFYGSVVAGQIAAGDISNFVTFRELLDRAEAELTDLDDVDPEAREEAQRMIDALRGKALKATSSVATGAGGALLANILGQLVGLPPS